MTAWAKGAGAALLLGGSIALAACGGEAPVAEENADTGTVEGISIENARLVLAPVQGNPAALYMDFAYEGDRRFLLGNFAVAGAESTVLHQFMEYDFRTQMMETSDIPVRDGTKIEFKPGDLHVMVMNPSEELQAGGTAEVTITVTGGDTHVFEAEIRAAGDER